eukprot:1161995-Pelagomonas_calceolata.AAC.1
MSLLWGQIVKTPPSMDDLLPKNNLQVVHIDPGSGAYGCSKLFKAVRTWQAQLPFFSASRRSACNSAQEGIACAEERVPVSQPCSTLGPVKVKRHLTFLP